MGFKDEVNSLKIERTMKALKKNNINAYFASSHEAAAEIVKSILPAGSVISCGGSESLKESGIMDLMESGTYEFLDRSKPGLTQEEIRDMYIKAYGGDGFFMSANAITENGELYNVDGNGNRVSALVYGPKKVIVIVGVNKIVKDMNQAAYRVKTVAAPCNGVRLNTGTPCALTGKCAAADGAMTDGCSSVGRMCAHYLITAYQRNKDRIHVIFLNEDLGY